MDKPGSRSNRADREFRLSAPDYRPPPDSPKKRFRNKEHRKAVVGLMGVGALLASVKEQVQGEEGELKEGEETGQWRWGGVDTRTDLGEAMLGSWNKLH